MSPNREFIHPTKILWTFPLPSTDEPWDSVIPSKTVRNLLKGIDDILASSNINISIRHLTEADYADWYLYYKKNMIEQNHDVIAGEDWFARRNNELEKIWLIEAKNEHGMIVGGSVISVDRDGVFTHHFKATDRLSLSGPDNTSLGAIFEFLYLRFAFQNNPKKITSGLSRNGFGYFNTLGYLAAKLRMGYIPEAALDRPWDNEFLTKTPTEPTIWFVQKGDMLVAWISPTIEGLPKEIQTYFERRNIPFQPFPKTDE